MDVYDVTAYFKVGVLTPEPPWGGQGMLGGGPPGAPLAGGPFGGGLVPPTPPPGIP